MQRMVCLRAAMLGSLAAVSAAAQAAGAAPPPHLERRGNVTQLIVEGKPFLAQGGELYNNAATSLVFMQPVWPRLAAMHLNTVLAPISWALLEPTEGRFDCTLVDGLIRDARAHNLRLLLLWFGSWKNTWSSYSPDWVKRDFEGFPRVHLANGSGTNELGLAGWKLMSAIPAGSATSATHPCFPLPGCLS